MARGGYGADDVLVIGCSVCTRSGLVLSMLRASGSSCFAPALTFRRMSHDKFDWLGEEMFGVGRIFFC